MKELDALYETIKDRKENKEEGLSLIHICVYFHWTA